MGYTRRKNGKWVFQWIENGKQLTEYVGSDDAKHKHEQKREKASNILHPVKPPAPDMPTGKYNVIYADPPWQYDFAESSSRAVENHYPTLSVREITRLRDRDKVRIQDKFDNNAVLYLWATAPKLIEALKVMADWGFTYKTNAVWDKVTLGMGYWFRGQHELLLVGVKGDFPPPPPEARYSSVIQEARTSHSKKPKCIYEMIEAMFPGGRYLELFARNKRDKWETWGNEA